MSLKIALCGTDDIFRNVFCPYYRECLNKAVKEHLTGWDCSICRFRDEIEPFDYTEAERCRELVKRVFFECI